MHKKPGLLEYKFAGRKSGRISLCFIRSLFEYVTACRRFKLELMALKIINNFSCKARNASGKFFILKL